MKSAEPRQLAFVFADSPKGDKNRDPQDESYGKRFLVHTTSTRLITKFWSSWCNGGSVIRACCG